MNSPATADSRPAPDPVPDLVPALLRLVARARDAGIDASPDRAQAFVAALDALGAGDPMHVRWAGRVTLCAHPQDVRRWDGVIADVFADHTAQPEVAMTSLRQVLVPDDDGARVTSPDDPDGEEVDPTHSLLNVEASAHERLRHRDIAVLTDHERDDLARLLTRMRLPGAERTTRRWASARRGGIDRHATVRRLLAAGGEPAALARRRRRTRPRDVVLLVDVSGSMTSHADALLRFAHATVRGRANGTTEVFTLGTRLTRVTRELTLRDPDAALRAIGRAVPDWSGGTRLGETVRAFLDEWGQRGTARGAVVVLMSDGWERGDVAQLREQVARLGRLAHRVVWANPRAGRDGFAPTAGGMAACLPLVDDLVAITDLAGLEHLADVVAGRRTGNVAGRRTGNDTGQRTGNDAGRLTGSGAQRRPPGGARARREQESEAGHLPRGRPTAGLDPLGTTTAPHADAADRPAPGVAGRGSVGRDGAPVGGTTVGDGDGEVRRA